MQLLTPATIRPWLLLPATPRREDLSCPDYSAKRAAFWSRRFGILQMSSFCAFAEAAVVARAAIISSSWIPEPQRPKQQLWRSVNPDSPGKSVTTIRNLTNLSQPQESG